MAITANGGISTGRDRGKPKKQHCRKFHTNRIRDFQYKYNPNNELKAEHKRTNKLTPQR